MNYINETMFRRRVVFEAFKVSTPKILILYLLMGGPFAFAFSGLPLGFILFFGVILFFFLLTLYVLVSFLFYRLRLNNEDKVNEFIMLTDKEKGYRVGSFFKYW